MRNNLPATQREVVMGESMMIVSKTDIKGKIEFINEDFLEIAGFEKEELIGEPHNIIRHPDMPVEAFEDMWRDLKAGLPWCGYVKNRVKNGDHYWVLANAMPLIEGGQTSGYVSIRSKPNPEIVRDIESVYRDFKEGKAKGLHIKHGRVVSDSHSARASRWFERLSNKILCVAGVLCLLIAIVGGIGIFVASEEKEIVRQLYEDSLVPSRDLSEINHLMYENVLKLVILTTDKQADVSAIKKTIEKNSAEIEPLLKEYQSSHIGSEEKKLLKTYLQARESFTSQGVLPVENLVDANKHKEASILLEEKLPLFEEVIAINLKLSQFKVTAAKAEYEEGELTAALGFWLSIIAGAVGVASALFLSRFLGRILIGKLDYLDSRLKSITGGNFNTDIQVSNDELENILTSVKALQAKVAFGESEKKQLDKDKKLMQEKLANDFEDSVKTIVNVVASAATELSQKASGMVENVSVTSQKANDASSAAITTTENVQSVAAAAEQLSSSVKEISGQLQKTSELVIQSRQKAENADSVASALTSATDRVAKAMEMIATIAGQINLLALNATIEAARAGEAGKGFAVVANEVKSLASQTDKTVTDIQSVTKEMRDASQAIISALKDIGESVGSISDATSNVASAVEEQSAVTNEIAQSMQTAANGTQTISENLQEVRASSTDAGESSEQMLQATQELSKQAENLNSKVDDFLARIRQS